MAEGLLERQPGHSARLRTFTADDVADLYRARRLIEFDAVATIVGESRSTAAVAGALRSFDRAGESWDFGADADAEFHVAVVASAGSPRLTRTFTSLTSEMRLLTALLRSRYESLNELYEEHAVLLEALESGDGERALRLWREHVDDAERFLTTLTTDS